MTSVTIGRREIFQSERMATLLLSVMQHYRRQGRFELHEFVVMPDHSHLLITPAADISLEKAVQFVKGGFSFRARKELDFKAEIWQRSFANQRVENAEAYARFRGYLCRNPVKRFLAASEHEFPYSSAFPGAEVDPAPPWLKPPAP